MKKVLIIHGWQGSSDDHWQSLLVKQIQMVGTSRDLSVLYPQFSDPYYPKLEVWLEELDEAMKEISEDDELIVVTHSLGSTLWLHYAYRNSKVKPTKVYLVAPVLEYKGIEELADFFPLPAWEDFAIDNESYLLVASDNDPYVDLDMLERASGALDIQFKLMSGEGHINVAAGYGQWLWLWEEFGIAN